MFFCAPVREQTKAINSKSFSKNTILAPTDRNSAGLLREYSINRISLSPLQKQSQPLEPIDLAYDLDGGSLKANPELPAGLCQMAQSISGKLTAYSKGDLSSLLSLPIAWERLKPFSYKIFTLMFREFETNGPQCTTYGELASKIGNPQAARAVGQAMAQNPFPLALPCHRVLPKNHALGHFVAGSQLKEQLLRHEGLWPWILK